MYKRLRGVDKLVHPQLTWVYVFEAKVAVVGFVLSGCQSVAVFELVEAWFDHVVQGIDIWIDGQMDQPVSLGRDHCDANVLFHSFANEVSIIAAVGQHHFGRGPAVFIIGRYFCSRRFYRL